MFRVRKTFFCSVGVIFFLSFLVLHGAAQAVDQTVRPSDVCSGKLTITGSSTMCPMISEISRHFQTLHHDVQIEVQCGGSDRGIRDIREGKADIGMIARALTEKEKGLFGFPMARDGVSLILHKSNPVRSLTKEQVIGIFTGRIKNWIQVGGKDAPISVILREKQKPVSELFNDYYKLKGDIRGKVLPGDNPVTINAVASNQYAISYISSGEAERRANAGVPIKILSVNNVMPTKRNIITGNYPITRPLSLVTNGLPSGMVKEFINYCLSSKVVDVIERFDFVPYED